MNILVLNCGSSSVKFQLIEIEQETKLIASGIIERIGMEDSYFKYSTQKIDGLKEVLPINNHTQGIEMIIATLTDENKGVIKSINEINAVGHRVAHGGEYFKESTIIDSKVTEGIRACCPLAPLHNPASLKGIEAITALKGDMKQVAVFDTSFHQTISKEVYLYPIEYQYYEKFKIRKYGFHGTSHKFVALRASSMLQKDIKDLKIISCHLGNGASITAIKGGISVDTTMGFTPIEGLMMGTRSGSVDAGIIFYLVQQQNHSIEEVNSLLNSKSGVKGISGLSSDMRDLQIAKAEGNEKAKLALDMYAYRIKSYIGSYAAIMGGVDLIIFTGGVGENQYLIRKDVCSNLNFLGIELDESKNEKAIRGEEGLISNENSKVSVMVVATNEELVIAQDTFRLVKC